jgi:hypothetical protein
VLLVGLHGYQGAGKDTVAGILADQGFVRVAFADKMREAMLKLDPIVNMHDIGASMRLAAMVERIGWDRAKRDFPEVRRLLQVFGTECGRELFGDDCWVRLGIAEASKHSRVVITDVRFPNEVEAVKRAGGFMFNVTRPGHGPKGAHASEQDLSHLCDRVVDNNGDLSDLRHSVAIAFAGSGYLRQGA